MKPGNRALYAPKQDTDGEIIHTVGQTSMYNRG